MRIGQTPVPVVENQDRQIKLVVVQNLDAATNLIVSTSFADCKNGRGITVGPGNATPQWQLNANQELYGCADPSAAAGTEINIAVIE